MISQNNQRGATMLEYVLVLGIFIVVFVGAAVWLEKARVKRVDSSTRVVNDTAPCPPGTNANECL